MLLHFSHPPFIQSKDKETRINFLDDVRFLRHTVYNTLVLHASRIIQHMEGFKTKANTKVIFKANICIGRKMGGLFFMLK